MKEEKKWTDDEFERYSGGVINVKKNKITNKPKADQKLTYLMFDGNLYKIGKSKNPENRLKQIKTGNPNCKLICYGYGATEELLHKRFCKKRIKLEWFNLNENDVSSCVELIKGTKKYKRWYVEEILEGKHSSYNKNIKYVITFGKFKGRKITSMIEFAEINYCKWICEQEEENYGIGILNSSRKYKALKWWITDGIKNYKSY